MEATSVPSEFLKILFIRLFTFIYLFLILTTIETSRSKKCWNLILVNLFAHISKENFEVGLILVQRPWYCQQICMLSKWKNLTRCQLKCSAEWFNRFREKTDLIIIYLLLLLFIIILSFTLLFWNVFYFIYY